MNAKQLPCSDEKIKSIADMYGTPFHLYDENGIRRGVRAFQEAFQWCPNFREYFAVKATPNPWIMKLLKDMGVGADCSSLAELVLSETVGLRGNDIVFSSNDTPYSEYRKAMELGAVINLDDISHIPFLEKNGPIPEKICFRYNPGAVPSPGQSDYRKTGRSQIRNDTGTADGGHCLGQREEDTLYRNSYHGHIL